MDTLVKIGRCLILLAVLGTTQTGCFLDRSGTGIPPSELVVSPANICPEDPINVRWSVWTTEPCWSGRPIIDTPRCSTINSPNSSNPEVPFTPGLNERSGSIDYNPGPSSDTTFSMTALVSSRRGTVRDDLSTMVNVVDVPSAISATAEGICGDNAGIELGAIFSRCVEINRICVGASNPRSGGYVISGWRDCAPGTSPDVCARAAFQSDALSVSECVAPADVGLSSFRGLRLIDIDWRRSGIGDPIVPRPDCTVEGSGFNPNLDVTFETECSGAYPDC